MNETTTIEYFIPGDGPFMIPCTAEEFEASFDSPLEDNSN